MSEKTKAAETPLGVWIDNYIDELYYEDQEYLKSVGHYADYLESISVDALVEWSSLIASGADELAAKEEAQEWAKTKIAETIKKQ